MNEPYYWYPQPELLLLTYKSNKSRYHGLDHVLRVWLYANLISQKISQTNKVDHKIISASAILHETGRISDRKSSEHIPGLINWVEDSFPVLWPQFTNYQIEMIKICIESMHKDKPSEQIPEALILSDANTLDKRNTPLGKIEPDDLIYEHSRDLMQIVNNIYERWQYYRSRDDSEFTTLRKILKDFPQLEIETPISLKKYLDEYESRDWISHFRKLEKIYLDLEARCIDFQNALLSGEGIVKAVQQIEELLDLGEQLNWQGDITTQAILFKSNQLAFKSLKIGLVDHGVHPSKRKLIKKTYNKAKKGRNSIVHEELRFKGFYNFLLSDIQSKTPNLNNSLINYLAIRELNNEMLIFFTFTEDLPQDYFFSVFDPEKEPKLSEIIKTFTSEELNRFSWLFIKAYEQILKKGLVLLEADEIKPAEKLYQHILDRSVEILSHVDLCITQCRDIMITINEVFQNSVDYDLDIELKGIQDLINEALSTETGLKKPTNSLPSKNLNAFNMYDGNQEEIIDFLLVFEQLLLTLCSEDWNCDELISQYLLPCSLNGEFNYSISEELVKDIKDTQRSINSRKLLELNKDKKGQSPHDLVLKDLEKKSRDNLEDVIDPSKYHSQVSNRDGYIAVSNPLRISTLAFVVENETTLLSTYNVLKADRLVFEHQLNQIEGDYYSRIRYRDGLERANCTRRPNILSDHIYYGMLINENDQFMYKKYLDNNNSCLLIFKDDVTKRSIFNLHDATWKNQQLDVLFEDAKYLYEKIRNQIMDDSSIFNQYYVEAGITNGVSIADIAKVLVNKKALKKKQKELEIVMDAFPEIEFKTI